MNKNAECIIYVTTSWFTVPFISLISDKFNKFNREDIKVSYRSSNKLSKFIKTKGF